MHLTFKRVAIINRSEAAMRVMNALQDLIDYQALERALAESRADAAWVGRGFVAEQPDFADLCSKLGVVFIGPHGDVMRRVGDKIASKLLAEAAEVPVVPWSGGPVERLSDARAHANRLGFPVMVKATAGGGGRGVRRVRSYEELANAFGSAQSEAEKYFGSRTMFLEKALVGARHVEVQVLADHHGTCWAVGVRDCTLQRRNQKVVEEAPLPTNDSEIERELCEAALRLTRAAAYRNAGTVEFLFDPRMREFYFMEMNARLQVEHPVTEVTTGVDLVKMQLFIASGGQLQGEPPATMGHAIEVRLNAEDPDEQFAPAPGRVELLRLPTGFGVRIDTGVGQGDTIAPEFDSMIAKLVAYGRDRNEALGRLRRALSQSVIVVRGGATNKAFLLELLSHPDVVACRTDIGWLDRAWSVGHETARAHADIALMQAAIDVYDHEFALEQKRFFASASRGRLAVRTEVGRNVELRYHGTTWHTRKFMSPALSSSQDGSGAPKGLSARVQSSALPTDEASNRTPTGDKHAFT